LPTHLANHFFSNPAHSTSVFATLMLLSVGAATSATAQTSDKKQAAATSPWSFSAGLGVARSSEYEGAKRAVSGVVPDFNVSYQLAGWGKISLGSKARGLSWTFIDSEDYSLGLVLQGDAGRNDRSDGTLLRPGSKRLAGMGEIRPTTEWGLTGHVLFGAPIYFVLSKGLGDGKITGQNFRINGHGGTRLEVGLDLPLQLSDALTVSVSPNLQWADAEYTQTYFGVTAAQAARTGFRPFKAKGGVKSVGLNLGVGYKLDKQWSVNAGVSLSTLRGDASLSPIVQKKNQSSLSAGFLYDF
jgi:MipA family protein